MASTDDYVALATSEHKDKPLFEAVIRALTEALVTNIDLNLAMIDKFDLDKAVGHQLDTIGLWVGMSRKVAAPLTGVYFTWDDTVATGWDKGSWQGPFDPSTGLVSLDDGTYRTLIRAKIAANRWDGTREKMSEFWDEVFGVGVISVADGQDMSITLIYDDLQLTTVTKALLLSGAFLLKPAGVLVNYLAASGAPLFSWDLNLPKFQGYNGVSVWT